MLLTQLIGPIMTIYWFWKKSFSSKLDWHLAFLMNATYLSYVSAVGLVWIGVSIYVKYSLWVGLVAASGASYRHIKSKDWIGSYGWMRERSRYHAS